MDKTIGIGFIIFVDYFAKLESFKKFLFEELFVRLFILGAYKPDRDQRVRVVKTCSQKLFVVSKELNCFTGSYISRNTGKFIAEHP